MTTFSIVEGHDTEIDYDEFKKDFISREFTYEQLRKKYGLSRRIYEQYASNVCEELGLTKKPLCYSVSSFFYNNPEDRYISKIKDKWRVQKSFGTTEYFYFGVYPTLEEARIIRDFLEWNNWSGDIYKCIKSKIFKKREFEYEQDVMKEFEVDYLNGMSFTDLHDKYGVSYYNYRKLSAMIKKKDNPIEELINV